MDNRRQHVLIDSCVAETTWGGTLRMRRQLHSVPMCDNAAFMGFARQLFLSVPCSALQTIAGRLAPGWSSVKALPCSFR